MFYAKIIEILRHMGLFITKDMRKIKRIPNINRLISLGIIKKELQFISNQNILM